MVSMPFRKDSLEPRSRGAQGSSKVRRVGSAISERPIRTFCLSPWESSLSILSSKRRHPNSFKTLPSLSYVVYRGNFPKSRCSVSAAYDDIENVVIGNKEIIEVGTHESRFLSDFRRLVSPKTPPRTTTLPSEGRRYPLMIFRIVVFPDPFGPTIVHLSPELIWKLMSESPLLFWMSSLTWENSTTGGCFNDLIWRLTIFQKEKRSTLSLRLSNLLQKSGPGKDQKDIPPRKEAVLPTTVALNSIQASKIAISRGDFRKKE